MLRDTDEDWKGISGEPFYGVFSHPDQWFRDKLTPERLEYFWETGRSEIDGVLAKLRAHFGHFEPQSAIDFGCGVGRLSRAIGRHVRRVIGVDVAPGMIEEAKRWGEPHIEYRLGLPDETVDWVNSIIVFQHIHPINGFQLLQGLLDRLNAGGGLSLQITIYRDQRAVPGTARSMDLACWDGERMSALSETPEPPGTMMMYDYDLNRLMAMLHQAGIRRMFLEHTDHGGFHGVFLVGVRE